MDCPTNRKWTLTTQPRNSDTDGDGLTDGAEVKIHGSDPLKADSDDDGMPDGWELRYGLQLSFVDSDKDHDGDGLSNLQEYLPRR